MSSGDKMAPFLASEMAWVCHVIFLSNATFIKTILLTCMRMGEEGLLLYPLAVDM